MSVKLQVNETSTLLIYLTTQLKDWSRKKIKQRLQSGCVVVNGVPVLKHNYTLNAQDVVELKPLIKTLQRGVLPLEILYSDNDLIAINKPAGLLSVGSAKENKNHALNILRNQLSRPKNHIKLWPVHRLDRETSGVLLFATSRKIREDIIAMWDKAEKIYLAVVEGHPSPNSGTIDQPLRLDNKIYQMHVGAHPEAKRAVTHFETIRTVKSRSLLKIQIDTGRQHQIRAHLAWLGHPVVGDPRYGTKGSRMGLHALSLSIEHPKTKKRLTFEVIEPDGFSGLMK